MFCSKTLTFTWVLNACANIGALEEGRSQATRTVSMNATGGVQPDDITFVFLLSTCSHAGLVDEGMHCYASMSQFT
ncbi:unnamed protein product [Sphagnum troendelagicum]|uniref:Secreted protein n=1 Tax=Sphagnum troendelagicum TaxID=128251 RepID=A0ABP0T7V9_9BRYO